MSYQKVQALLNRGISRPTLYRIIVPRMSDKSQEQLSMLVKLTRLPEISMTAITANGHDAQGVSRQSPGHAIYSRPFSVTVIADSDYTVYKDMRNWFESCIIGSNPFQVGGIGIGDGQKAEYYDTITSNIELIKLEYGQGSTYKSPFTVTFNNAFPVRIGDLVLDSSAQDSRMEFEVDFFYETYTFRGEEKRFEADRI